MQGFMASLEFEFIHLARADFYLGREWLYNLGLALHCSYQDNGLEFMHEGRVVRIYRLIWVLATPLIFYELSMPLQLSRCVLLHP